MEERKLNFNAPLLSVRRFSSTPKFSNAEKGKMNENTMLNRRHTLPFYNSDLNLEQVTEPATVPFMWEKIPGKPKDGKVSKHEMPEEASVTPRLPPGRFWDVLRQPLEKEVEEVSSRVEAYSSNGNVAKLDCSKEGKIEKGGSDLENDDGDAYSDALDTLSPTDSFSANCSVSGLSGCDGPLVKRSGTFSTDPQTRDFMMRRFLPAAKAMALEPPQYASKKQQIVAVEQPKQIKKVLSGDRRPLANQYESIVIPHYAQDKEEEESEEEDVDYHGSGNITNKACGLIPRLCFKNSLCLLNPVPAMKIRTQASMSSVSDAGKSSEAAYVKSHNQPVKKHAADAVSKQKSYSGVLCPKLIEEENKSTYGSNRFTYVSDRQTVSRSSSPFRRIGGGGVSPYRNGRAQSPFRGTGFLGVPKETENVKTNRLNSYNRGSSKSHELLSHNKTRQVSRSVSPMVEKTLYVDTVNIAEKSCSNSGSSDIKSQMDYVSKEFEALLKSRKIEENAIAKPSLVEVKCPNSPRGGGILEDENLGCVAAHQSTLSNMSDCGGQAESIESSYQESMSLACIKWSADGNQDVKGYQNLKADDPENVNNSLVLSTLPPPLPKTPSESWLWRTLPSVTSRNPFSHSYIGKKQDPKTSSTNTKWETIVKTSYSHHDHARYSEELVPHVSHQSKT